MSSVSAAISVTKMNTMDEEKPLFLLDDHSTASEREYKVQSTQSGEPASTRIIYVGIALGTLMLIAIMTHLLRRRRSKDTLQISGDTNDEEFCTPYARHWGPPFDHSLFLDGYDTAVHSDTLQDSLPITCNQGSHSPSWPSSTDLQNSSPSWSIASPTNIWKPTPEEDRLRNLPKSSNFCGKRQKYGGCNIFSCDSDQTKALEEAAYDISPPPVLDNLSLLSAPNLPYSPIVAQEPSKQEIPSPGSSDGRESIQCRFKPCNKTFTRSCDYKHHERYHLKPKKCHHCKERFGIVKDLNRHINTVHQGPDRFFSRRDNCKRHMTIVHKKDAEPYKATIIPAKESQDVMPESLDVSDVSDMEAVTQTPSTGTTSGEETGPM